MLSICPTKLASLGARVSSFLSCYYDHYHYRYYYYYYYYQLASIRVVKIDEKARELLIASHVCCKIGPKRVTCSFATADAVVIVVAAVVCVVSVDGDDGVASLA